MDYKNKEKQLLLISIPLTIIVTFIPLIVRLKKVTLSEETMHFWNNNQYFFDLFSFYKSAFLIVFTAITLFGVIYNKKFNELKYDSPRGVIILIFCYILLVITSTVFSEYRNAAIWGFPDRFEGAVVTISYIMIFFAATFLGGSKVNIKIIIFGLLASSSIIALIGIMQFFQFDVFKTEVFKNLIIPRDILNTQNNISISYPEDTLVLFKNTIYSTLYNSNSFGSYIVMVFPLGIVLYLSTKKASLQIFSLAYSVLIFANIIGCGSRGAYAGAIVAFLMMAIFLIRTIIERWRSMLILLTCFGIVFTLMNFKADGTLFKRIEATYNGKSFFTTVKKVNKIIDFSINKNELVLISDDPKLKLKLYENQLLAFDNSDKELEIKSKNNKHVFIDERYENIELTTSGKYLKIQKGNSSLYFSMSGGIFNLLDANGEIANITSPDTFGFKGREGFASSRGYIWSRSITLIKDTLLIGKGPDTFAFYFPQEDYLGKLKFMRDAYIIIDKPHNFYLQTAINTGVPSLIVILILFGVCLIRHLKKILDLSNMGHSRNFSVVIFSAIISYLVTGLFTDSVVSVAPVFWILLGIGYGSTMVMFQNSTENYKN